MSPTLLSNLSVDDFDLESKANGDDVQEFIDDKVKEDNGERRCVLASFSSWWLRNSDEFGNAQTVNLQQQWTLPWC